MGAIAPSRNNCSRREPLEMLCAPPSVSATRVMRVTASPTTYFARYSAGCLLCRSLRVAEPGGAIGDQARRLQVGAQFRDAPAHVGMIGKRLRITVRLPRMHDPAQLVVRRNGNAEIDRRVG